MGSTTGQSVTLANSIIGVGILAMPFCFQQCGILLASVILLSMGLVSRLSCYFLLKSAFIARKRNFEFLAYHVFGPAGKLAVEVGIIGFLMGTCIAYFVVVGDLGPQIIAKILNINQSDILRTSIMVLVSLLCVLPLGLLRNVDSLSNVSAATIAFYFCLVIKIITEAGSQLLTGEWQSKMALWKPAGVLQCVPIFSMALFCQAQLFEIFQSLPSPSLEKMNLVTKNAINICTAVYFTLGLFGYIAFCNQNISGNILMSLSETLWSDVIKLGFVMSLAFSFPLVIFPCRASLYSLIYGKSHTSHHDHLVNHSIPESTFRCITVGIIAVSLFISLLIPNIELVLGLVGSTIGVMICIVFPAACFINLTFKDTNERVLAKVVLILGLFVTVLGTYANLQAAESNRHYKYDVREITPERIDKIVEEFFQTKKLEMGEDTKMKVLPRIASPPKNDMLINAINKDSVFQPPNPLPPDSPSNKKESIVNEKKLNKESSQHEYKEQQNKPSVNAQVVDQLLATNALKKLPKNGTPKPNAEEKNNEMLKQKLIETIKQHGEEQKELLAEQKEILHEIKKTEEELKQKKDIETKEAKLMAVESIQQIADVAIKKLSGVESEKNDLEQKANKAVEEIAKKAVSAIEAIKQTNPKSENAVNKIDPNVNKDEDRNKVIPAPAVPVPQPNNNDVVPQQNITQLSPDMKSAINGFYNPSNMGIDINSRISISNIQERVQNGANDIPLNPNPIALEMSQSNNIPSKPVPDAVLNAKNVLNKPKGNVNEMPDINTIVQKKPNNDAKVNEIAGLNTLVQNNPNIEAKVNEHIHSPDEPQSYKQGEDIQKVAQNIINNVPLPLAINNQMEQHKVQSETVNKAENTNKLENQANVGLDNTNDKIVHQTIDKVGVQNRQKREVQDCEKKNNIVINNAVETLSSKIDFNDVALPKSLPMDANVIHHLRSLKSIIEAKRR